MGIQIISISHKKALQIIREMFAFTEEQQEWMMKKMTNYPEMWMSAWCFPPATGRKCMSMPDYEKHRTRSSMDGRCPF